VALYADVQARYCLGQYGSRKIKSKRRNGGTRALREEAAKSGAGGPACTVLPQANFFVHLAA
jgi:hypothetical protein